MVLQIRLPDKPKVVVRGKEVFIIMEEGFEIYGGEEKSYREAVRLAYELEVELKAVDYVKQHLLDFIEEMREYLTTKQIDERLIDSIIDDGHFFARIEYFKSRRKTQDPDSTLKVFNENTHTDYFIV